MSDDSRDVLTAGITEAVADYLNATEDLVAGHYERGNRTISRLVNSPFVRTTPMITIPMIGSLIQRLAAVEDRTTDSIFVELRGIGALALDHIEELVDDYRADEGGQVRP